MSAGIVRKARVVATAWAFVYPVAGIQARVREIWQISRVVVRDFSHRTGKGPPVIALT